MPHKSEGLSAKPQEASVHIAKRQPSWLRLPHRGLLGWGKKLPEGKKHRREPVPVAVGASHLPRGCGQVLEVALLSSFLLFISRGRADGVRIPFIGTYNLLWQDGEYRPD